MQEITTRWFSRVNRDAPLSEYPRPQFVRKDWICLNGLFDYAVTGDIVDFPVEYDGKIVVPFAIESKLSGVQRPLTPDERLWYRTFFSLDERFDNKRVLLHFGAVDWQCEVYINGRLAGEHTGGYNPFSMDITALTQNEDNELVIRVYDPTESGWQQRGKQVLHTHGFWYTATSGIWQTVWLEPVDECRIKDIKIFPDIDGSSVRILTDVTSTGNYTVKVVISENCRVIYTGSLSESEVIRIENPRLWSPEEPFLYDVQLKLFCGDKLCDRVESYFGMRKFGIDRDDKGIPRLTLNNKPYFQKGLLDQGYWCDGGMTPPTDEAMIFDIETARRMGFNMIRKHIKVEPLRWYYHCDRIGMIVWQDMVSGGEYIGNLYAGVLPNLGIHVKDSAYRRFKRDKEDWRDEFKNELFEMIDTLFNSVSIGCWVPFNEGWGQFDAEKIGKAVKRYDPSRVVDHASGWHDQNGPELKSVHKYILPVRLPKSDDRPFVLSEFGGYSMIVEDHVWNRKKCFGYRMFKNKAGLTAAYAKLIEKQIIPLVSKGLCATVYTQISDVENEVNGLLTYDRDIQKMDEAVVRALNERLIL